MLSLLTPWPWLALVLAGAAGFANGVHFDNKYGTNARLVAAMKQELADTNAKLAKLKVIDETEIPIEDATRNQSFDSATQTLIRFGSHCKANRVDADVLMGLSR